MDNPYITEYVVEYFHDCFIVSKITKKRVFRDSRNGVVEGRPEIISTEYIMKNGLISFNKDDCRIPNDPSLYTSQSIVRNHIKQYTVTKTETLSIY